MKFLMHLGVAICAINSFVGCSDNGSATKPNDETPQSSADETINSSAANSATSTTTSSAGTAQSSTGTAQSSSSIAQNAEKEPVWNTQYPITLNESEGTFTIHFGFNNDGCSITDNSAEWISNSFEFPLDMVYEIQGNKLSYWYVEGESEKSIYTGNNQSIIGIWKSDESNSFIKFTQDTLYSTEQESQESTSTKPTVESEIDLTSSYIMYDLYGCGTEGFNCIFSHWHFTKKAPDFILDKIETKIIDIHEKTDRTASLTFVGKDLTINVEHVQLDSLNNGKHYIAATIQSQGDTCRFEHISADPTRELCTANNVEYLSEITYEGEDGKKYSARYFNDNDVEFAQCVSALLK